MREEDIEERQGWKEILVMFKIPHKQLVEPGKF